MSWELTDDEIKALLLKRFPKRTDILIQVGDCQAIATAAVQKYQQWLASQCGPEPCGECSLYKSCDRGGGNFHHPKTCLRHREWKGQQAGLAKGLAIGAYKVVDWLDKEADEWTPDLNSVLTLNAVRLKAGKFLASEGITR